MSRIGKLPISLPVGVEVSSSDQRVTVKGPKGTLYVELPRQVSVTVSNSMVEVRRVSSDGHSRAHHGLIRAMIANAVTGVTSGWQKELELVGVGYRAKMVGNALELNLGYSHPITVDPPGGVTFQVQKDRIIVGGIDKQTVGQIASDIRKYKKPEPYKGKGIRYAGEVIRRKAGKSAKAVGGSGGGK